MPIEPISPHQRIMQRFALNGPTMGTRYAAAFFAPPQTDLEPVAMALKAAVETVDGQMSTFKPGSALMQFNGAPVGDWIRLPAELLTVLAAGVEVGRRTDGAFDMGMGEIVAAWGFGPGRDAPDAGDIARIQHQRHFPAHEALEIDRDNGRARKLARISLDLGGIAKGYGVDRLAETLQGFGIVNYLASIDGEVRAGGGKPGGAPWQVAVEKPDPNGREIAGIVALHDGALATSGDYRHRVHLGGRQVSHTMDPRTGRPLDNGVSAVTVRASTCMLADAWATALMVIGEPGRSLTARNGMEAMVVTRDPASAAL